MCQLMCSYVILCDIGTPIGVGADMVTHDNY